MNGVTDQDNLWPVRKNMQYTFAKILANANTTLISLRVQLTKTPYQNYNLSYSCLIKDDENIK